jgi:bacillolysin
MKNAYLLLLLWAVAALLPYPAKAQNEKVKSVLSGKNGSPSFIEFNTSGDVYRAGQAEEVFRTHLGLGTEDVLRKSKEEKDAIGFTHHRYTQFYKGIKVEHGTYIVHEKGGIIHSINGEFKKIKDLNPIAGISERAALQNALSFVGARSYKWQNKEEEAWIKQDTKDRTATFYPKGELVLVEDELSVEREKKGQLVLAYKFDIYAQEPLSRNYIYVNAQTGEIVFKDAIIKHAAATGTAATRYSSTKSILTDSHSGSFRLRDYTRGNGIETWNMKNGTNYGNAVDFTDNDNNWTATEYNNTAKDNAALDAHFGAQKTYDYFKTKFNRNSFNNAGAIVKSYVHYGSNYENAFWDGSRLTYGDGASRFDALTSLDVAAHEFGHAVCSNTANLVYSYESGALNEGFSDIWGAAVEHYTGPDSPVDAKQKDPWLIGEEIDKQRESLRSMKNPKAEGQPDTYLGTYWYTGTGDNGGVHYNSGVINHWFYILSVGKSGTNDHGTSYAVTGIGIDKAAAIAYRTESVYLTSTSVYNDARTASIKAAADLYGAGTNEVIQTTNAWNAVGVGGKYGETEYCHSQGRNASYEWIAKVQVGSFENTSGSGGYSNFTGKVINVQAGTSYSLTLTPGFSGRSYNEYWKVWIDYNGDGDFEDAGELAYDAGSLSKSTRTGTLVIPATASGTTRMRVSMKYNAAQSVCETFDYGEVEDYTISITNGTVATCAVPGNLASANITSSSATLSWGAVSGATGYELRYKATTSATWITPAAQAGTTFNANDLSALTQYEFQVKTNCSSNSSAFSASSTFTTLSAPVCDVPGSITSSNVTSNSATLSWGAVSGATGYELRYKATTSATWITPAAQAGTTFNANDLSALTQYEFQVKTNCSSNSSAFSTSSTFTTLSAPSSDISYCTTSSNSSKNWIDLVQFGGISNSSGKESGGYRDYTSLVANVAKGATSISYSAGMSGGTRTIYWKIWIDYNQDGTFADTERVVGFTSSSTGTLTSSFTIPAGALVGNTRMRVLMSPSSTAGPCGSFSAGEVEDYTVNISSGTISFAAQSSARAVSLPVSGESEKEFAFYPNPSAKQIHLQIPADNSTLTIFSLTGAKVKTVVLNQGQQSIDVSTLAPGVYMVTLNDGANVFRKRLLKE